MMVGWKRISATLGLLALAAAPTEAHAQAAPASPNQATANRVASVLQTAASQTRSVIEIEANDGLVTLTGTAPSASVKAGLIATVRQVPGVSAVADRIQVAGDRRVQPADYQPVPAGGPTPPQVALGGHHRGGGAVFDNAAVGNGAFDGVIDPNAVAGVGAFDSGPVPEGPAGAGGTPASTPRYPNYAWPSYAPYPNFSAVGYPTVYPWQAWPNIGPFYPYPEVPLDWRAVTAKYHDGLWHVKFRTNYTRPFIFVWPFNAMLRGY